ncbi:uncharacterized protein METZ01_LOCUS56762 [marine metagenome]|uniref:Uncharacterized protein n=1 Tax=marine metagenome TaxID=408172 RepID=A0A381SKW7_9ZZZZ
MVARGVPREPDRLKSGRNNLGM